MAHFILEISASEMLKKGLALIEKEISAIIESVGGRLIEANHHESADILTLLVEANSEFIVVDLLESQALNIEHIRHMYLLQNQDEEAECVEVEQYVGFFRKSNLLGTLAIEIYPE